MNKIIYWMRKLGMLRTASYKVSGNAEKLNKMSATDGGMIQGQKEIDEQYKKEKEDKQNKKDTKIPSSSGNNDKNSSNQKGVGGKVIFWIFIVIAVVLCGIFLLFGFSMWFLAAIVLWGLFLKNTWSHVAAGSLILGKTVAIGIALVILTFFFIGATMPNEENTDKVEKSNEKIMDETDDSDIEQEIKDLDLSHIPEEYREEYIEHERAKAKTEEAMKDKNRIVEFFEELKKETGIEFGEVMDDANSLWTGPNVNLELTDAKIIFAKKFSQSDWSKIDKYFTDLNSSHGSVAFTFTNKTVNKQEGYIVDSEKYPGLMCVVTSTERTASISCGWGPGGGE